MKKQTKIKCEFTDAQLRDIAAAVLLYMSHIDKKLNREAELLKKQERKDCSIKEIQAELFKKNPLIQNYLKIHDLITDAREYEKSSLSDGQ